MPQSQGVDVGRTRVLESRLNIPEPDLPVIGRSQLVALIDQVARCRVTTVCAPAGAGKTVACASWATARSRAMRVAWVDLDDADNHPAWFWASVYSALKASSAASSAGLVALEDESAADFPLQLARSARFFVQPVTIVLDNVHMATDDLVLKGLEQLSSHAPPRLHLLLSGRQLPRLRLDRMRAAGEVADIGAEDLGRCAGDGAG